VRPARAPLAALVRWVLVALVLGGPAAAAAQTTEAETEARRLFDEGVAAFGREDYATALVAFERAYALSPRAFLLYNIGMCHRALLEFPDAIDAFRRYLAENGAATPPEQRREVEAFITEMEASLAAVTIVVNVEGAALFVDGEEYAIAPLPGPLRLAPGSHVLEARRDGYRDARLSISVMAGETLQVALALSPLPTSVTPPTEVGRPGPAAGGEEEEEGSVAESPWLWIAVGAVLVGGAVTAGVLLWPDEAEPAADWVIRGP
jgi:tetratricopeptide (TPR) repeat protein